MCYDASEALPNPYGIRCRFRRPFGTRLDTGTYFNELENPAIDLPRGAS